jgi:hypothetical protein
MNNQRYLQSALIIFFLSIVGMSVWLYEIVQIKGWNSLSWISEQLYSPFFITALPVVAFPAPFILSNQLRKKVIGPTVIILYLSCLFSYWAGKQLCYTSYNRFGIWSLTEILILLSPALLVFLILSIIFWLVTNRFIRKSKRSTIFSMSFILMLCVPLSLLTIKIN